MASQPLTPADKKSKQPSRNPSREMWLRKHSDYQRVYREGKRQSLPLMTYFFAMRPPDSSSSSPPQQPSPARIQAGPRVGLTAGKVVGGAVVRNRIKRRMRAVVRRYYAEIAECWDVVLHPRRAVLDAEFSTIERDVRRAFQSITSVARATHAGSGQQ